MIIEIREKFCPRLLEKCARLKYAYIEDAEIQDKILRVTKEPESELYGGFSELLVLVSMVIRIVGIVAIIASKLWWCGVFVLLLHLPIVYFARKNGESAYQADKDFALHMRRYEYLNKVLVEKDSAMERNLFQILFCNQILLYLIGSVFFDYGTFFVESCHVRENVNRVVYCSGF